MNFAMTVKKKLFDLIDEMELNKEQFVLSPGKHFTRNRKIGFSQTILFILSLGRGSSRKELLDFFDLSVDTPTVSALHQQRQKLNDHTFFYLFYQFNSFLNHQKKKTFKGYQRIAFDGSCIPLPNTLEDSTYLVQRKNLKQGNYYQIYLHAAYDLCNHTYVDLIMEPRVEENERVAAHEMLDRGQFSKKTIFIADRGYEEYKMITHIMSKEMFYLFRVKDGNKGGILYGLNLPKDEEFDKSFHFLVSTRNKKAVHGQPEIHCRVHASSAPYFLNSEVWEYPLSFRVVRVKLSSGEYECLMTNLPEEEFSSEELKQLYWMRWGIETSFRELKYTVGICELHSKKLEFIRQEILARMILYNFCEIITANVVVTQKDRKYIYEINRTMAIHVCWQFLRWSNRRTPPDVEALLSMELTPIRPDRSFLRKIIQHPTKSFTYRPL